MGRKTVYNRITSQELISQINPENMRLLTDFITYMKSIQRSEKTISSYYNDILIFYCWNLQHNKNKFFIDITKRDIISYQNYLISENKNSPARVRRLKSTLSSMSNYIEAILDDEFEEFRPIIRKVESPVNMAVREKTVLEDEQLDELLKTLVERGKYMEACAVSLAMNSGSRKSEIPRFKVDYFKDENIIYGSLYKTSEKIKTKGRGLGKFIYRYVLVNKFKPYLELWLKQREELGIDNEYLFVTRDTDGWKQLRPETLNSWAEWISDILGVDFYWHCLRHYYTTTLARNNLPDGVIQEIIGWDSAEMVKIYKDIDTDEQLGQYFDESGIKQVEVGKLTDLNKPIEKRNSYRK
jgi:integrase